MSAENRAALVQALRRVKPDELADMIMRYSVDAPDGEDLTLCCNGRATAHSQPGRTESITVSKPDEWAVADLSTVLLAMFDHEEGCHP